MTTLRLIIPIFISITSYGQSNFKLVKNWKSYEIPTNQDTVYKYKSDKNDWIVSIDQNEIYAVEWSKNSSKISVPFFIKPTAIEERTFRGKRFFMSVDDGYLIGFNRGESGGYIFWFSKDGTKNYKISDDNIVQFKNRDNKIYAIAGLEHLSMLEGSIIEIKKEKGKWVSVEYLKIPTAPVAVELDTENNLVIVTSSSLLSVDTNKNLQILIAKGIWDSFLYPNSLVIQNETLFIGMRKGIFKYNLLTKKEEWLLPD